MLHNVIEIFIKLVGATLTKLCLPVMRHLEQRLHQGRANVGILQVDDFHLLHRLTVLPVIGIQESQELVGVGAAYSLNWFR